MSPFDAVTAPGALTGEGPLWDATQGVVWWTDIPARRVHRFDPARGMDDSVDVALMVGALALRAGGGLVAVTEHGLAAFDWPTGTLDPIVDFIEDQPDIRCNDANVDPAGRLFVGTLSLSGRRNAGTLFRVDGDHVVTPVLEGVDLCNGIDWSLDAHTMYFSESRAGVVWAIAYDVATGALGERRVFASFDAGVPDGLTVDAVGDVWVAEWGGACVRRFRPDGALTDVMPVPALHSSCPAFGGPGLDTVYVTTACGELTEAELAAHPLSGALFRAHGVGRGRPLNAWTG